VRALVELFSGRNLSRLAVVVMLGVPAPTHGQTSPALVDRSLTVGAGATLAVAAGDLVARAESLVIPDRLVAERGTGRRAANIAYRTGKLLLFDLPQESWLMVANHELFGHGGRVRELFDGYLDFHIDAPAPYGNGGGATFFAPERSVTIHELQAVSVAGMEVNAVGAALIAKRAFAEQRLTPRAALRYLVFELDVFDYIRNTGDDPERDGHDVSDFLELYNLSAEFAGAPRLAPATVRNESWISLANPMVASAAVAIGRYLITGDGAGRVWSLPVAGWDLMPAMRYRLTPFGTEWAVVTHVARSSRAGQVEMRVGRAPLRTPWAMAGMVQAARPFGWQLELGGELWRQPPLALGRQRDFGIDAVGEALGFGGAIRARTESPAIRFWGNFLPASLVVDLTVKSRGFAAGDPLDRGVSLRAGLGLPIGRR
jgi:hypothetical protein